MTANTGLDEFRIIKANQFRIFVVGEMVELPGQVMKLLILFHKCIGQRGLEFFNLITAKTLLQNVAVFNFKGDFSNLMPLTGGISGNAY